MPDLRGLPGAERVEKGLRDLEQGLSTEEALLLEAASGRLRDLGLPVPELEPAEEDPELRLYALLQTCSDDAYNRYNALRRELDSFVSALEMRLRRSARS